MNRVVRTCTVTVKKVTKRPRAVLVPIVIKTAAYSVVPATVNDVMFHHAKIDIDEVVHSVQDSVVLGAMGACIKILFNI